MRGQDESTSRPAHAGEDGTQDLTIHWSSDYPLTLLGTGTNVTARLEFTGPCSQTHTVPLTVTDTAGNVTTDSIRVRISALC